MLIHLPLQYFYWSTHAIYRNRRSRCISTEFKASVQQIHGMAVAYLFPLSPMSFIARSLHRFPGFSPLHTHQLQPWPYLTRSPYWRKSELRNAKDSTLLITERVKPFDLRTSLPTKTNRRSKRFVLTPRASDWSPERKPKLLPQQRELKRVKPRSPSFLRRYYTLTTEPLNENSVSSGEEEFNVLQVRYPFGSDYRPIVFGRFLALVRPRNGAYRSCSTLNNIRSDA